MKSDFDLIAPIAIYHYADVMYKKKAQGALTYIRKHRKDLLTELEMSNVDDPGDSKGLYDRIFRNIVGEVAPDFEFFRDKYGALGVKNSRGAVVFTGGEIGAFPWYETETLLVKRLTKALEDEMEDSYDY